MVVEIRPDTSRATSEHAELPAESHPEPIAEEWWPDSEPEELPRRLGWGRAGAIAALLASLTWVLGMLWLARGSLPALSPVGLVEFLSALAVLPILAGMIWLLSLRTSRAEADRFAHTAAAMRAEAASLDRVIEQMSFTMEGERQALANQIADLMARGDAAHERLATIGRDLAGEIAQADAHARTLAEAATGAQASVGVLLASLPRARTETEQTTQLLDRAGLAASEHAGALDAQLHALAERGREADHVAGGAAQKLAAHLARMEGTSEAAAQRLEAVTAEMTAAVDALLGRTADAVDQSRQGIAAQGDAMLAMVGANQAALDSAARNSADALEQRLASVDAAVERVTVRLDGQRTTGGTVVSELENGLERVEARLAALHAQGVERSQQLAESLTALGGSADAMTGSLKAGEDLATRAIGTTESLLIALDSAAREIDETLPEALGRLDDRIGRSRSVVASTKPELLALVTAAETTHDAVEAIAGVLTEQRRVVDQLATTLSQSLDDGRAKADGLGARIDETAASANRLAEDAAPRLVEALLRVRDTAQAAADKARETLAAVIPEVAQQLETAGAEALRRATSDTVDRQLAAITSATAGAEDAAARAAERIAAHVEAVLAETSKVEGRIADARQEREDSERQSFSQRVSVLIDALNTVSIDITKSLAPEVADTAWAAYLKGDRGVFNRRAVRLIEPAQAREIARLYDGDDAFREQVNRYIQEFESMLRAVLDQRDGSALGVTLISSDMGKLYVALAQAIDRLR